MVRAVLGFVIGAVVWIPVFFFVASGLAFWSADYAQHARSWMDAGVFEFTAPQAAANVLFWMAADVIAGWLTGVVARRREAVWALAAVVLVYLASLHIVLYWPRFPWWYNLGVVIPSAPAVLLGGRLAGRFMRRAPAAAAG